MGEIINLFTDGTITKGDREFTRLVGGFNEIDSVVTTKQIAELLNLDNRVVNQTINRNIKSFTNSLHIIDLKSAITESDSELLDNIGYTKNAYNASKNVFILSKAGFLLYLKFAEGDKAVEIYKDFLEDYFKTKAENAHMKNSIQDKINEWEERKASAIGKSVMAKTDTDRMRFLNEAEECNRQIIDLEKMISQEETIKAVQSKIHLAEKLEHTNGFYDIGVFSKVLEIKGMGRNNLYKWLREEKILNDDKIPYQNYMNYFKVTTVTTNGYVNTKALIKPKGIDFLVKRLIKKGKITPKSIEEIKNELESQAS